MIRAFLTRCTIVNATKSIKSCSECYEACFLIELRENLSRLLWRCAVCFFYRID